KMKKKSLRLLKKIKQKGQSIILYLKNKKVLFNIIIGGVIGFIILLLALSMLASSGAIIKVIKVLVISLYGGLVFMIIWRKEVMYKKKGKRKRPEKNISKIKKGKKVITQKNKKKKPKAKKLLSIIGIIILVMSIL